MSKTFRLFISSTFNDLKEERNILQNTVFPEIKKLCKNEGFNFEPIDLRWGVNNEASLDHKAMDICLLEVQKALNYPKPNFLILLGNRYGWIPVQNKTEKKFFEKLLIRCESEEKALLLKWYKCDYNCQPPAYILQPIDMVLNNDDNYEKIWIDEEEKLRKIFLKNKELFPSKFLIGKSATEHEIIKGVLETANNLTDGESIVFTGIRNIINKGQLTNTAFATDNEIKLRSLKNRLKQCKIPKVIYKEFDAQIIKKGDILKPNLDYLEELAIEIKTFLMLNISTEIKKLKKDASQEEKDLHRIFMEERSQVFIGRDDIIKSVMKYINSKDIKSPLVVHGSPGAGKSALFAYIVKHLMNNKSLDIVYRFVGISEASSNPTSLLNSMRKEILSLFDIEENFKTEQEYDKAVKLFLEVLDQYSKITNRQLIIIIDALDQFTIQGDLAWIENELPENIKLLVSVLSSENYDEFYKILRMKIEEKNFILLNNLSENDAEKILQSWLVLHSRNLQKEQKEYIIQNFKKERLALYLKVLFEKSMQWHSYDTKYKKESNDSLEKIIKNYFDDLVQKNHHPKILVEHTLGYLSAAKNGLSEDELVDILSSDKSVMEDISNPFHHLDVMDGVMSLPAAVWSRLYYDLSKYLTFIEFDKKSLMSFYHRKIAESVHKYYYKPSQQLLHVNLLEYFWNTPLKYDLNGERINLRKLSELPYHCIKTNSFAKFLDLVDVEFIHYKVQEAQLENLLNEILEIVQRLNKSDLTVDYIEFYIKMFAVRIVEYLLKKIQNPCNSLFSVEYLHALYAYKEDTRLYNAILEITCNLEKLQKDYGNIQNSILEAYYTAFSARKANMLRRKANLSKAMAIYNTLEKKQYFTRVDNYEQSRIFYDIGYIAFLSGKFEKAIEFLHKSVKVVDNEKDQVSKYISLCIAYRIEFLTQNNSDGFLKILLKSYSVFYESRLKNPVARRWIKNINAHLFEVYFDKHDLDQMKKYYNMLVSDEWMTNGFQKNIFSSFTPYEARIALVEQEYKKAASLFEGYLYEIVGESDFFTTEAISRNFYDYLYTLKMINKDKFLVEKEKALKIPDVPGNHIWNEKIKIL